MFTSTVDAVIAGLHSLDVRAYTLALSLMETPVIAFEGSVGQTRALATLFADVDLQNRSPNALVATPAPNRQPTVGQVTIGGNVTTTGSQTYRGASVALGPLGQTITLTANSGVVDIITRTGIGAGSTGLDQLRLQLGNLTELGAALVSLLRSANIDLSQVLIGKPLYTSQLYLSRQDQAGEFFVDVREREISSLLMMGEVEVGDIGAIECAQTNSTLEGDCTPFGG
jgi:hypothetical protein